MPYTNITTKSFTSNDTNTLRYDKITFLYGPVGHTHNGIDATGAAVSDKDDVRCWAWGL